MSSIRRMIRLRGRPAACLIAACCLLGCLFKTGDDGPVPTGPGPVGGKDTAIGGPGGSKDTAQGGVPAGSGRGYYTLRMPAGAARLHLDSVYAVGWQASDSAGQDRVRMSLYRNDTLMEPVVLYLPYTGSLDWNLGIHRHITGNRVGSGSGYRLRVENERDPSRWDDGPAFALYSDHSGTLRLTEPAAGSVARTDAGVRIAWTASGEVGPEVGLQLFRDTALVWTIPAFIPAADGQNIWSQVPENIPSGEGYRFRIYATADASIEHFGPSFTLKLPDWAGAYTFLRPESGAVGTAGSQIDVEWKVAGNPGSFSGLTLWRDSPREEVWGWTPGETGDYAGKFTVPADLPGGTYRFRLRSLADTSLSAFSEPFLILAGNGP